MKCDHCGKDTQLHKEAGSRGGKKSAAMFTKKQRSERARKAAQARWGKKNDNV